MVYHSVSVAAGVFVSVTALIRLSVDLAVAEKLSSVVDGSVLSFFVSPVTDGRFAAQL